MKKKKSFIFIFLLSLSLTLSGCGSNNSNIESVTVEPVTVEADTIQTKEIETQETIPEKVESEETVSDEIDTEIIESEEAEIEEVESEEVDTEEVVEEDNGLEYATKSEINALTPPTNLLTVITDKVKEKHEAKLAEKAAGITYQPETIISDYTGYSDAEIIQIVHDRFLELHNEKRAELGVAPLTETNGMRKAATIRAEEISYFWSHTRPDGSWGPDIIPWDGLYDQEAGENIVWWSNFEGKVKDESSIEDFYISLADSGFNWLCNSPSHYEAIINPKFKVIGIDSYVVRYKDFIIVYTAFEFASY